jgi:Na+/H+ antiporter NhaC
MNVLFFPDSNAFILRKHLHAPDENAGAKILENIYIYFAAIFVRIALTIALYLKFKNVMKAESRTRTTTNNVALTSTYKQPKNSVRLRQ